MRAFEQNVRPELPANQCRRDFMLLAETCLVVENTDTRVWPNPTPLVPGLLAKSEETALRLAEMLDGDWAHRVAYIWSIRDRRAGAAIPARPPGAFALPTAEAFGLCYPWR